ncbi:MAG: type II toxin-antitoxin system HicB family antitoxin [Desulfamplus sp.]|nr:type II toxin-antitoxin system HicB family antitoxin [Desulfamplus sp.]
MNFFYKVIIEPQEEGGFTAYIPSLPGCVSEGETYDETTKNIKEALNLYVETLYQIIKGTGLTTEEFKKLL